MAAEGVARGAIAGNVPTSLLLRDLLAVCKNYPPSVKNLRHIGYEILGAYLWDRDRIQAGSGWLCSTSRGHYEQPLHFGGTAITPLYHWREY